MHVAVRVLYQTLLSQETVCWSVIATFLGLTHSELVYCRRLVSIFATDLS